MLDVPPWGFKTLHDRKALRMRAQLSVPGRIRHASDGVDFLVDGGDVGC